MVSSSYRQKGTQQNYRRVVAITLESGVLYPVVIFVVLVVGQLIPTTPNLFAILAEVVAIALVPIIMRLTLGDNINDERTSTHNPELVESDIRRAEEGSMNSRERPSTFEGGDTSTVEDNDTTYHPAQSNMSLAPFSNTTSPRSTIVPNSIIVQVPPGVDINNEQTTVYSPGNARSRTRRAERGGTLQERFSVLSGGHTSTNYDSAQSYMSSPPRSNATSPHPTLREQAPSPLMR
ncbi:hypothetical protein GYMLUDRAFT_61538 [Collybiopsis luxurians FD-317 M1]|uniref:Uncharacterized protein n=1 Tax=Collybiopsis luxurians FD-317 M1 TaxID=944289 RepID=A0A0D0CPI9_9AGAR|nr:hypothetical protein GYMLUDRAFT_61538 [Collybiopsis luxurians FD-317 M1]